MLCSLCSLCGLPVLWSHTHSAPQVVHRSAGLAAQVAWAGPSKPWPDPWVSGHGVCLLLASHGSPPSNASRAPLRHGALEVASPPGWHRRAAGALHCTCLGALVCVTGHGPDLQLGMSPGGRQDWGKRGRVCGALATALLAAIPPRHPLNSWSHQQLARSSSAAQRAPPCLLDRMHGHPPRLTDGVPAPSLFVASCHQQPDVPAPAPGRPLHRRRTNALKLQRVVGSRC